MSTPQKSLPPELILDILSYASCGDLLKCTLVCQQFRTLVAGSDLLQYHKELYISGKEDLGAKLCDLDTRARLAALREHVKYWDNIGSKPLSAQAYFQLLPGTASFPAIRDDMYTDYMWDPTDADFVFIHLPTLSTNLSESPREFKHLVYQNESNFNSENIYTFDPSQDLFALLKLSAETTQIWFWTISTGEHHPENQGPVEIPQDDGYIWSYVKIVVCGAYVALLKSEVDPIDEPQRRIIIWNWKTGTLVSGLQGHELKDFAFITTGSLLIGIANVGRRGYPCIFIWNFEEDDPWIKWWGWSGACVFLDYPRVKDHYYVSAITFSPTVLCAEVPSMRKSPSGFLNSRVNQFLTVTICIDKHNISRTNDIQIPCARHVIPAVVFDRVTREQKERSARGNPSRPVDWSVWGPLTRIIPDESTRLSNYGLSGSRLVASRSLLWEWAANQCSDTLGMQSEGEPEDTIKMLSDFSTRPAEESQSVSKLAIYDFNQVAFRHSILNGGILVDDPIIAMMLDRGYGEPGKTYCVRARTQWYAEQFEVDNLNSPLATALPYRLRFAEVPDLDIGNNVILCTTSHIIISPDDEVDTSYVLTC